MTLFISIVLVLVLIRIKLAFIKRQIWTATNQSEANLDPESYCPNSSGNAQIERSQSRLFYGPRCHWLQSLYFQMFNYPVLLSRMILVWVYYLPKMLVGWGVNYMKFGTIHRQITDEKICEFVFHSSLLIAGSLKNNCFYLKIDDQLTLETSAGIKPAGLQLVIDLDKQTIISANWQDQSLLNDKQKLFALLIQAQIHWAHPQTHLMSELSARQITFEKIDLLEPSQRFVNALHDGLLFSGLSPIVGGHPYTSSVKKQTLLDCVLMDVPHNIDRDKVQFRYFNFLWQARMVLMGLLEKHKLPLNAEYLFHNMIIHSVDHYLGFEILKDINSWSLDCSGSLKSHAQSVIFRSIWVRDNEFFLLPQRIKRFKRNPFYNELYQELAKIDKPLADNILCSTSF